MNCIKYIFSLLLIGMLSIPAEGQQFRTRHTKPQNTYFFVQSNLHAGLDTREPGDQVSGESFTGLANRGPASQVTFELFSRRKKRIQLGYTRFISVNAWNVKFALQATPMDNENLGDIGVGLKLGNTWMNFSTKWDRTRFRVGHQSIPFGHNPRIDGNLSFLPSQAGKDIGFGTDTGIVFRTGLNPKMDLEVSATAGGFLSGSLVKAVNTQEQGFDVETAVKYRGSWLGVVRVGSPTFFRNEIGVFVALGQLHQYEGDLPAVGRIGADWVFKKGERWKVVTQANAGLNNPNIQGQGTYSVFNILNSAEMFVHARLRLGVTNVFRLENRDLNGMEKPKSGTIFGMISIPITRTSRLRINPFIEYHDSFGEKDKGVMLQVCTNCGLIK